MASGDVLKVAVPLLGAAEAAAALGASLRMRGDGAAVAPELAAQLDGVLDALGVRDAVDALDDHDVKAVLGIVEGLLAQAADFVVAPGRDGWNHDQPSILLAQGHSSALVAEVLHRFVVPELGDELERRLAGPDAVFLDVGAGVAALAIAVCRLWPSLRVVALDPLEPALAIAHDEVAAAGLQERVEVREGVIEELVDEGGFDFAWLPTMFIPRPALEPAMERMLATMRPGGWATFGLYARPGDPFRDALADLRTVRQGGALISPQEVAELLDRAGFADVGVHFEPEWQLPVVFVAGRRP
ncbi:MAG: hypothetical protein QOI64_2398 [Solirubrobacteraceae bacterium]|nr:hypothetical protein [Solirubrobacteraceae bacterium]